MIRRSNQCNITRVFPSTISEYYYVLLYYCMRYKQFRLSRSFILIILQTEFYFQKINNYFAGSEFCIVLHKFLIYIPFDILDIGECYHNLFQIIIYIYIYIYISSHKIFT